MTRVYVVVEGFTEESFITNVLAEVLWPRQVHLTPVVLGTPGHKGGNTNYARVKKDIVVLLKQDPSAYCSTMLDFYGLGRGFPGMPLEANLANLDKVARVERAVKADIVAQIPHLRPDVRFVPYLQLHEYEGLLFSDPAAFASGIGQRGPAPAFERGPRWVRHTRGHQRRSQDGPVQTGAGRLCLTFQQLLKGLCS